MNVALLEVVVGPVGVLVALPLVVLVMIVVPLFGGGEYVDEEVVHGIVVVRVSVVVVEPVVQVVVSVLVV